MGCLAGQYMTNVVIEFQRIVFYSLSLSLPQFHIANSTTSTYVRTIQLPLVSVENVTKMVTSDNGEYVFALTPSTVSIDVACIKLFGTSVLIADTVGTASSVLIRGHFRGVPIIEDFHVL